MNHSRTAKLLLGLVGSVSFLAGSSQAQQPEVLYRTITPGPHGNWIAAAYQGVVDDSGAHVLHTSLVLGESQWDALLQAQHVLLLEGQPFALPGGVSLNEPIGGSLSLSRNGDLSFAARLSGTPGGKFDDQVVTWNGHVLAQEGDLTLAGQVNGVAFTPGTTYSIFVATHTNDRREVLVLGSLDDDGFKGKESYASLLRLDLEGKVTSEEFLAVRRYPFPGTGEIVDAVSVVSAEAWALNDAGNWMGLVQLGGDTALVKDGAVVLRTGQPSPAHLGRNVVGFLNLSMNNDEDFVVGTLLDGSRFDNTAIVMNGTDVVVSESDTFPDIAPQVITRFDGAPLRITDDGAVFWYASTDNPDSSKQRCYFRSIRDASGAWQHRVLVQQGVTRIGDQPVLNLSTNQFAFDVSSNGRHWFGRAGLAAVGPHSPSQAILSIDL